jgi:hypothetical protein
MYRSIVFADTLPASRDEAGRGPQPILAQRPFARQSASVAQLPARRECAVDTSESRLCGTGADTGNILRICPIVVQLYHVCHQEATSEQARGSACRHAQARVLCMGAPTRAPPRGPGCLHLLPSLCLALLFSSARGCFGCRNSCRRGCGLGLREPVLRLVREGHQAQHDGHFLQYAHNRRERRA